MSVVQSVGNLNRVSQELLGRQPTAIKTIGKRGAFDEFHNQVLDAILMTDIVQSANIRMIQARHSSSLTLEPLA